jgi:hypothetical protein
MTFEERLEELISGYWRLGDNDEGYYTPEKDPKHDLPEETDANSELLLQESSKRHFNKWRMLAEWLLIQKIGADHPYTVEFLANVTEPSYSSISAGIGILKALQEDYERQNIKLVNE